MATDIVLDNGLTFEGKAGTTLDSYILETIDFDNIMPDFKRYQAMLHYTDTPLLNPSQTFAAKSAPSGMEDVTETGLKKQADFKFKPKKGVYQQEVGRVFTISYYMTQWIRKVAKLQDAPGEVQAHLIDVAEQTRDLIMSFDIRKSEDLTKVLTKGFAVTTANGPGSATPKGNPLFYASQPYGVAGTSITGTFSNTVTGAVYTDVATGTAQLQAALNLIKQTKDDNGKFIREPGMYKLYVSRVRLVFWKQVLNNGSQFSGQGPNAMQENQFLFQGNKIEIVQLDSLGQPDYQGNLIGTSDMAFLMNPEYITQAKALRSYNLYAPKVKTYDNDETDEMSTSFRGVFGMDHYGAELGIVGIFGS
jgi:hypothetical protein